MNEPYGPGPHDPHDPRGRNEGYPPRPQDPRSFESRRFETQQFETQQFGPRPHEPQPHQPRPYEPLAHEGGFAYGNPPAPPASYGHPEQFVPAHLQVPHPYGPPMYQQPYMYPHQMAPHLMQQTVFVNGGNVRRVNHALHLVLTILTAGLWLPVWIILAIANS